MPAGPEPMTAAFRPVFAWASNGTGGGGPPGGRRPAGRRLDLERDRRVEILVEHRLDDLVAGIAVAVADGDRLVDLVAPAVLLAGRRADPSEDRREGDRALEDPRRLAPVAFGVLLQER